MVEDNGIDIQYIHSEDKPADIMTKKSSEADCVMHMKRIIEGELWEIVDTGSENVNNTRVTHDFINRDNTEYYSHALAEVVDVKHKNN